LKKRIYIIRKERLLKRPVNNDIEKAKRQSIKDLSIKATIRKKSFKQNRPTIE